MFSARNSSGLELSSIFTTLLRETATTRGESLECRLYLRVYFDLRTKYRWSNFCPLGTDRGRMQRSQVYLLNSCLISRKSATSHLTCKGSQTIFSLNRNTLTRVSFLLLSLYAHHMPTSHLISSTSLNSGSNQAFSDMRLTDNSLR